MGDMWKSLDFHGNSITGLADAAVASAPATWGQVQALLYGLQWKSAVRVATTGNITLSGTQTIDTVALSANDRVLVKDQTTGSQNGIYLVQAGAWLRSADLAVGVDARGIIVPVLGGSVNDDKNFAQNADPAIVGTDALIFTAIGSGSTSYTAGLGLSETPAGTFNVDTGTASATGLEISADTVRLAAAAAGNGLTGGGGSALAVGAGSGISVTADAVAVDSTIPRRYTNSGVHTAGASVALTHNIGHLDYVPSVKLVSTGEDITAGVDLICTTTTLTATFSASQGANSIRLTAVG